MSRYRKIGKETRDLVRNTRAISRNRSGQIGETATWIVATLIIIGTMILFILFSFLMSKTKAVGAGDVKTDLGKNTERLSVKTSIAEQLNSQDKQNVENILNEQNGGGG